MRSAEVRAFGTGAAEVQCEPPPSDRAVAIDVQRGGVLLGRDISGCVLIGPAGNVFQQLYGVVSKY